MAGKMGRQALLGAAMGALLAAGAANAADAPAQDPRPPRIATADFAQQPLMHTPRISPDGTKIVTHVGIKGKDVLGIVDLGTGKLELIDSGEKFDINWYRWAGSDRVLISLGQTATLDGEDYWATRLLVHDVTTPATRLVGTPDMGILGDDVLWVDPAGQRVIMALQTSIYDYPSVWSLSLADKTRKQILPQRDGVWDWYADTQGVVRAGFEVQGDVWRMLYRAKDGDPFKTVVKARADDDDAGFDAVRIFAGHDDGYRIMLDDKSGLYGLYHFNFATRARGDLVLANDKVDIDDFDTRDDNDALIDATFTDDHPRVHWFDEELAKVQAALDASVPGRTATIISVDKARDRMIVLVGATNNPGAYYVFDEADGRMHKLASINEHLDANQLAVTQYTHYAARDGVDIPAYLTLPKGRNPHGLPLIILPHGGPYDVRDEGEFDEEVQFYANRGYVVLQPEYRGSGGYGKPFYDKGAGQWGRVMQDDLDDGMDWLAKQGTIDPKRVCMIGSSYGGYAALWGATRNPERYRCAASFAGISDLKKQLKYQIDFKISKRYQKDWRKRVQGDDGFDLRTVSPLYTIDRLKVPILLMHGDADPRVPYKQSKLYADALKAAGKPAEFYTLKGEGHGFSSSENEQMWFDKLDAFLAKYNPAD